MTGKKFTPLQSDICVGRIIAISRRRMGMSQKELAEHLGITFQQIQKYETGGNRISAGKLMQIAAAFEMSPGQLLDGATHAYMHDRDIMEIIELLYKMNQTQRSFILQMAQYIAAVK